MVGPHGEVLPRRHRQRRSRLVPLPGRAQPAELAPLAREYQADYLLTYSTPRLPFAVLFRNDIYTIYRLPGGE